jgi:hypothetical protein
MELNEINNNNPIEELFSQYIVASSYAVQNLMQRKPKPLTSDSGR